MNQESEITHFNLSTDIPRHNSITEIDLSFLRKQESLVSVKINHGERLQEIDLRVLPQCQNLRSLEISHLWSLKEIDLQPLAECPNLIEFKLNYNTSLKQLDLQPLAQCRNLQRLEIRWNGALRELNLEPLSKCDQLRSFHFTRSSHHLSTNLTPLVWCENLTELTVEGNAHADSVLTFHPAIRNADFYCDWFYPSVVLVDFVEKKGWNALFSMMNKRIRLEGTSLISMQHKWMTAFGLGDLGVYDGDLRPYLQKIPNSYDFGKVVNQVKKVLESCMVEQIKNNGPTRHIDIERLQSSSGVIMVPFIVDRRNQEINNLVIAKSVEVQDFDDFQVYHQYYDLKPLWVTQYGYEILRALEMGLKAKDYQMEEIKNALKRIGLELQIGNESKYSVEMSQAMKEYLLTMI
ncbi:MAG: hypothetical protein BAJATHORv1_60012 [Candidatus Thorarchaeota archaeon]|nr:MAG: hypothetical protein BAJATHORv1_60012 [Candidatus Thorarchaeota archaeon]